MAQDPIIYDYPAIAKRAREITSEEARRRTFELPRGCTIILSSALMSQPAPPSHHLCLVLQEHLCRLIVDQPRRGERERILEVAAHLANYFRSVRMVSIYEMSLSKEDTSELIDQIRWLQR